MESKKKKSFKSRFHNPEGGGYRRHSIIHDKNRRRSKKYPVNSKYEDEIVNYKNYIDEEE